MSRIEDALRARLQEAGCYPVSAGTGGRERWFSPHLGRTFELPVEIATAEAANAVLRAAGMEEAFPTNG